MPQIVTVNVSQLVASAPSRLQKTGALVTQGGTNTSANTVTLLTQASDFTAIKASTGSAATELQAQVNTFFAQGSTQAVYVLELGSGTAAEGVTALTAYILAPTVQFYSYLVPLEWDTEATAPTLYSAHASPTSQVYFYVTTTTATYTTYADIKSVFAVVASPSEPSTEFSTAAFLHATLSYSPSASNLVAPLAWQYLYGVTANTSLTNSQQAALLAAGVNWVGTGAEGGISNTLIVNGAFMDTKYFNYWYAIDWLAINVAQSLSAAVINGSNNPLNPLYYNQAGINRLQQTAQATVNSGIAFGMILSPAKVLATPFTTYVAEHPADYATGTYAGLSVTFVPARGFTAITINLVASNIPV
jgi:hypothetical protein